MAHTTHNGVNGGTGDSREKVNAQLKHEGHAPQTGVAEGTSGLHGRDMAAEPHNTIAEEFGEGKSVTDLNDNMFDTEDVAALTIPTGESYVQFLGPAVITEKVDQVSDLVEEKVLENVTELKTEIDSNAVRIKLFTSYEESGPSLEASAVDQELGQVETVPEVVSSATPDDDTGRHIVQIADAEVAPDSFSSYLSGELSSRNSPNIPNSTESRDNPFIPDGELSKETDELLKRATIIRDRFFIDQQERQERGLDSTDHVNVEKSPAQESVVVPVSAQAAHTHAKGSQPACAEVKPRMRENGRVEDSVSPEGIKPEIDKGAAAPAVDGSKTSADAPGDNGKEKKKQKKCCSIM